MELHVQNVPPRNHHLHGDAHWTAWNLNPKTQRWSQPLPEGVWLLQHVMHGGIDRGTGGIHYIFHCVPVLCYRFKGSDYRNMYAQLPWQRNWYALQSWLSVGEILLPVLRDQVMWLTEKLVCTARLNLVSVFVLDNLSEVQYNRILWQEVNTPWETVYYCGGMVINSSCT